MCIEFIHVFELLLFFRVSSLQFRVSSSELPRRRWLTKNLYDTQVSHVHSSVTYGVRRQAVVNSKAQQEEGLYAWDATE